jgi:hypothetical protein
VPHAYLSFDFKGVPFLEPCYSNIIVEGVNDHYGPGKQSGSEGWRKEIWDRCSVGLDWQGGEMPPFLEVSLALYSPRDMNLTDMRQ